MANYGISIPDDLSVELDRIAARWRSNRSQAIVRIFLEWQEAQLNQLPLAGVMEQSGNKFEPAKEIPDGDDVGDKA